MTGRRALLATALTGVVTLTLAMTAQVATAAGFGGGAVGFASHSGASTASLNSTLWPKGGHQIQADNGYNNGNTSAYPFSIAAPQITATHNQGITPVLSWGTDFDHCDACVAQGNDDATVAAWANNLRSLGFPVVLRLDWEMNGSWYGWGTSGKTGNTPASFVAMWRHMHDVFIAAGATNVAWFYSPNTQLASGDILAGYPGDAYTDLVGVDLYNWGSAHSGNKWQTFTQLMSNSAAQLRAATSAKPWVLGEVASCPTSTNNSGNGQTRGSWITDAFLSAIPNNFPEFQGFLWFNENYPGQCDFKIQDDQATVAAMQQVAGSSLWRRTFPLPAGVMTPPPPAPTPVHPTVPTPIAPTVTSPARPAHVTKQPPPPQNVTTPQASAAPPGTIASIPTLAIPTDTPTPSPTQTPSATPTPTAGVLGVDTGAQAQSQSPPVSASLRSSGGIPFQFVALWAVLGVWLVGFVVMLTRRVHRGRPVAEGPATISIGDRLAHQLPDPGLEDRLLS